MNVDTALDVLTLEQAAKILKRRMAEDTVPAASRASYHRAVVLLKLEIAQLKGWPDEEGEPTVQEREDFEETFPSEGSEER